ncbi:MULTISPECIES: hypothetical protein [Dictyoglomus]|jgi:uncharacterized CHY-type Zn-finger protein|uniref:Uncharacterized protein n=1 Tax=Dictyoglomus turgidum (strain DSM 6724 / Z-1310) TaxID=515635 RepID=B8DYQ4_DICTD|nr:MULTISPECIES: hypothetical protein [Dictyoglomus]ACK41436.1 conserved hypothetical protein [Dictyoglomus turgidum DSM 6724]PNV79552.1 MAG: hypothetical protein C0196_05320 [Dictyoglomus turgidum]HBU31559.1 hypothetical protein [Dictyoglomus sp.]
MRFKKFIFLLLLLLVFSLINTELIEAKPRENFNIKGSIMFIGPSGLLKVKVESHSKNIKGFVRNDVVSIKITSGTKFYFASFVKTNEGLELKKHKSVGFGFLKIKSKVFINGFILENNKKELVATEIYIILN